MTYSLPAIRIKCAELVGWKHVGLVGNNQVLMGFKDRDFAEGVPNFPSSADAALQLVEWMAKPENGSFEWAAGNIAFYPKVTFGFINREQSIQAIASTLPLAICLAILRANGVNPETL